MPFVVALHALATTSTLFIPYHLMTTFTVLVDQLIVIGAQQRQLNLAIRTFDTNNINLILRS